MRRRTTLALVAGAAMAALWIDGSEPAGVMEIHAVPFWNAWLIPS